MSTLVEEIKEKTPKIVLVGDGTCGKTCLLMVYIEKKFPIEYIPTVFDSRVKEVFVDGQSHSVLLMDTSGQEDYERLRALQYLDTDVFILCFSVDNHNSFENVKLKWIKELKHFKIPIVLVAMKTDLRDNSNPEQPAINTAKGAALAKKIKAVSYVECSAKLESGVEEVFQTAVKTALNANSHSRKCIII